MVACAEVGGDVVLHDTSGRELRRLPGQGALASGEAFSPDGERIAVADGHGYVTVWDTRSGERLRRWRAHYLWANRILWSPDGALLATTADDATLRVWDLETGSLRMLYELDSYGVYLEFSPDSRRLFFPFGDRIVSVDAGVRLDTVETEGLLARTEAELHTTLRQVGGGW